MTTISHLLNKLQEFFSGKFEIKYVHPLLYIICVDEEFGRKEMDERYELLANKVGIELDELLKIVARGSIQIALVNSIERKIEYSFLDDQESGRHWLSWFARSGKIDLAEHSQDSNGARAIHFYGFKGGQARSTVLVLLAKFLADNGRKVLIVDADVEAPSLDAVFDVVADSAASTLMGLCGWADEISPLSRVYVGTSSQGSVDLIPCRPRSKDFDVDFAGFLLGTTLDARITQNASAKLRDFVNANKLYDYVFFDHRTGLAPSVLPLMNGWPGSTVVFVRPDGMSRNLESSSAIEALLSHDKQSPGAFVSFSLDPQQSNDEFLKENGKFIESLLVKMSDALSTDGDIDPTELLRYWILWRHDSSMFGRDAPSPEKIGAQNRSALNQIIEILGLELGHVSNESDSEVVLSKSGAVDEGHFVLTPELSRLFSKDSRILYIFGRKGTGKTRLLKELSAQKLGTPLLVASDFSGGGIQSGGVEFNSLLKTCDGDYEVFWWALLYCALYDESRFILHGESPNLAHRVTAMSDRSNRNLKILADPKYIEDFVYKSPFFFGNFLIDGIETAVPASDLRRFVESLFRFLSTLQYSKKLSSYIRVRLFLRSDLYKGAVQNVEQQIEGCSIDLRWDRKSILNFCVARIHSLSWFKENFSSAWKKIDDQLLIISRGGLSESDAETLLLEIFPVGLERNRLKTTTFFATYFSDAGGDGENKASFYPRLFDGFLRTMNDAIDHSNSIKDGRLNGAFVLESYDRASNEFIDEVKTELYNLLEITKEVDSNREAVNNLLVAFSGIRTPFVVDDTIKEVSEKTGIPSEIVRDSVNKMKQIGIFEDRPGYSGWWRSGRLYKSGLKMKYVRAPAA